MSSTHCDGYSQCHVVALPYPGRGHINPMMNVCRLLASNGLMVTFVVTEEWFGLLGSAPNEPNLLLRSIPNVIPSELNRGADYNKFLEAVYTRMEDPFDQLLDQFQTPVGCILADTSLPWAVTVGNRRKIPVASFFTQAPLVFALYYHSDLLIEHGHCSANNSKEKGDELIDYIPGIPSVRIAELPSVLTDNSVYFQYKVLEAFSCVRKAQYILLASFHELQPNVSDYLRAKLSIPIYNVGPSIPYMLLSDPTPPKAKQANNVNNWLDLQPEKSVLYVSLGSFKPVSNAQMHEIGMALRASGVRYLWIARGEVSVLQEVSGDKGLVLPWCEQLKVLCHSSVGAFLTHCGWNSTLEGVYAGVPMLTFPLFGDQMSNSKFIVDDWKVGLKVKNVVDDDNVVGRETIARTIQQAMVLDGDLCKELRRSAKELQAICHKATNEGGSSHSDLHAFITDLLRRCANEQACDWRYVTQISQ